MRTRMERNILRYNPMPVVAVSSMKCFRAKHSLKERARGMHAMKSQHQSAFRRSLGRSIGLKSEE